MDKNDWLDISVSQAHNGTALSGHHIIGWGGVILANEQCKAPPDLSFAIGRANSNVQMAHVPSV